MTKVLKFYIILLIITGFCVTQSSAQKAIVKISINHFANGKKLHLGDSTYYTSNGEPYLIKRLKYYISRPGFKNNLQDTAFLIDASGKNEFEINVDPGTYPHFIFTLGIDSLMQSTGAQTGALDVMNGMFWTWNSGYINFKLEGYSDSSTADLNRIEHHIGGYRQPFATDKKIEISFTKPWKLKANKSYELLLNFNLDEYFKHSKGSLIKENALIMSSGQTPFEIAQTFPYLFTLQKNSEQ